MMEDVLVTGAAGFIGFHLSQKLLNEGMHVSGIDNLNNYYDVNLKEARLKRLMEYENFTFYKTALENRVEIEDIFRKSSFEVVVHLAAQAGVRYSIENPHSYVQSNVVGFLHVLEAYRRKGYAYDLTVYLIHKLRAQGTIPFVHIEETNIKSMNLAMKLGFRKDRRVHWFEIQ